MTALSDARDALDVLLAGITLPPVLDGGEDQAVLSYTYVPEAITPPCLVQEPGDDYVTLEGTTFNAREFVVSMDVFLLVDLQDNEAAAAELDALVEAVVLLVGPSDWNLQSVGKPQAYNTTEWLAHGVRITLDTYITL